jgi:dihydroneopterin aldolase
MSSHSSGHIHLQGVSLPAYIGVPASERSELQVLKVHLTLWPQLSFSEMADEVSRTIDYAEVVLEVRRQALAKPRALIETLADDLAEHLLQMFQPQRVRITILKHILPGVEHVAVETEKTLK